MRQPTLPNCAVIASWCASSAAAAAAAAALVRIDSMPCGVGMAVKALAALDMHPAPSPAAVSPLGPEPSTTLEPTCP